MLTSTTTQQNQDMIMDEFRDEGGINTATSTESYSANGDFYSNISAGSPTGGTITTSGGNTIHTFNSSGTFVVPAEASGDVEYLVIAGGGGGGGSGAPN
jgi:hypothetical protein